jgi:hypothetical protein
MPIPDSPWKKRAKRQPDDSPKREPKDEPVRWPESEPLPTVAPITAQRPKASTESGITWTQSSAGTKRCPSCGSESIQKASLFDSKKKSGGGCGGCITCLLVLIVLILAPLLIIGPAVIGAAIGIAAIALYWKYIIGFFVVMMLISAIGTIARAGQYVCLRCGKRFHP